MDQSRAYIQMCRSGTEIQRRWQPQYGDFYVDVKNRVACWLEREPDAGEVRGGFRIHRQKGLVRLEHCIWLPRLDQLMELAQVRGRRFDRTTLDFHNWARKPYLPEAQEPGKLFASLEQLWLAYVMMRRHGKRWQEDGWYAMGPHRL
jgi:hypothetical protein